MIVFRDEFIRRYLIKLHHKAEQELEEKLPKEEPCFFAELVEDADEIMRELFKKP
ncbi:MAG: hypothetical protein PHW43_12580 [Syntrophales bacterium]|nr:hypothetical protein [Syntrophales bacterium]